MAKQRQLYKKVSIEMSGKDVAQTVVESGFLSKEFLNAITNVKSAQMTFTGSSFSFSASRDDFQTLADKGAFLPSIKTAFESADKRLMDFEKKRNSFGKRLWDVIRHQDQLYTNKPVYYSSEKVTELKNVEVIINRYGV